MIREQVLYRIRLKNAVLWREIFGIWLLEMRQDLTLERKAKNLTREQVLDWVKLRIAVF